MSDYPTTDLLREIIDRIGAATDRIDQLHRDAARQARADHERARTAGPGTEGGDR